MKKALGLKDKMLGLYAEYSMFSMLHEESSKAFQNVLDLSCEIRIRNYDKIHDRGNGN